MLHDQAAAELEERLAVPLHELIQDGAPGRIRDGLEEFVHVICKRRLACPGQYRQANTCLSSDRPGPRAARRGPRPGRGVRSGSELDPARKRRCAARAERRTANRLSADTLGGAARCRIPANLKLQLDILPQPDDTTCGPTCLHAVYRYFGDDVSLERVVREVKKLRGGGTLAVLLGCHALHRGYSARLYSYNLNVFDPTWFDLEREALKAKLMARARRKRDRKLRAAIRGYIEYLDLGGELRFNDLQPAIIREYLTQGVPVLTGLSATYLYRCPREFGKDDHYDDIRGDPSGHFVVLCGYDREEKQVLVADPMNPNPAFGSRKYLVDISRLVSSILLGIVTYDANMLVIKPGEKPG